jgi:hypothetical protein
VVPSETPLSQTGLDEFPFCSLLHPMLGERSGFMSDITYRVYKGFGGISLHTLNECTEHGDQLDFPDVAEVMLFFAAKGLSPIEIDHVRQELEVVGWSSATIPPRQDGHRLKTAA